MTVRTSARQYANALFDVATRSGRIEPIQRDLAGLTNLVASHAELADVLTNRAVPAAAKRAILAAIFTRLGTVADEVQRLLTWLADRDRLVLLAEIEAAFGQRVLEAAKIVNAEVTTTVPLDEPVRASLTQALSQALGQGIALHTRVDPSLVGGLVARVGSVVFDGSVTRQIARVREQLLAGR